MVTTTKISFGPQELGPAAPDLAPTSRTERPEEVDAAEIRCMPVLSEPAARDVVRSWSKDWEHTQIKRTPEEKERLIAEAVAGVEKLQTVAHQRPGTSHCPVMRAFHPKATYVTTQARFNVAANLPKELQIGPFAPAAEYRVIARFSNAPSRMDRDETATSRGLAFRLVGPDGQIQDFNMGSTETLPTKDGKDIISMFDGAIAGVEGGLIGSLKLVAAMAKNIGVLAAIKAALKLRRGFDQGKTHAAMTFFTRVPFKLGEHAVKFRLVPEDIADTALRDPGESDALMLDFVKRRAEGTIRYKFQMQGFTDPERTPIDDISRPWSSEWITVGELSFPKQAGASEEIAREVGAEVSSTLAFTPFHQWGGEDSEVLKPLGDINMLRQKAYKASADGSGRSGPSTLRCPFGHG